MLFNIDYIGVVDRSDPKFYGATWNGGTGTFIVAPFAPEPSSLVALASGLLIPGGMWLRRRKA